MQYKMGLAHKCECICLIANVLRVYMLVVFGSLRAHIEESTDRRKHNGHR